MKTHPLHTARGFSLLEVLVALVILATGLLALAKFQGTLMQDNALSKQRTEATMIAQQKIELLRAYSLMSAYTGITAGNDTVSGTSADYTRSWTVTQYASTTAPQYTTIAVTVSWTSGGSTQSYSLTTNIAANDPLNTGQLIATTSALSSTSTSSSSSSSSTSSSSSSSSTNTSSSTSTTSNTNPSSTTTTTQPQPTTCSITISVSPVTNNDTVYFYTSGGVKTNCQSSGSGSNTKFSCALTATAGQTITLYDDNVTGNKTTTYTATATTDCKSTTATASAWK